MNIDAYLSQGEQYHDMGYETDGCTFVGWYVHSKYPELEKACWSHDFARKGLIKVDNQGENDNLFKDALKQLGAPRWLRFVMYTFTKSQGFMKDKLNMNFTAFLGLIAFLIFVGISFYYGVLK